MQTSAEEIKSNWDEFIKYINLYIEAPRKRLLLNFYEKYKDRLILYPAAHKKEYHGAFPGGYINHILNVIKASIELNEVWVKMGVDFTTYTFEELIFSAINHDLGKIGTEEYDSYIPQTDQWRKEKLGENYKFNDKVPFASVPDRGLYLLQANDIKYSFNEMLAIQTHDGLYDEANKKYLQSFGPDQKPRTSLPYILHQADLMATRIEFEQEWLPSFKSETKPKESFKLSKKEKVVNIKNKALGSVGSKSLQNMLDKI